LKIKAVIFDIEDTLYDSSLQMRMTRLNAVRAMIEAGFPIDLETGYKTLEEIVNQYGPHNTKHFDSLLERLGLKWNPRVIAAGVVAYRQTSDVYLKPFPDTIPTLVELRDQKYKLGVVSEGRSVKQWQKLIQLGVHYMFHSVVISEDVEAEKLGIKPFKKCLEDLDVKPVEAIYISSRPNKEILYANEAGITTVRIRQGDTAFEEPESPKAKAKYEVNRLSEILNTLDTLKKETSQ